MLMLAVGCPEGQDATAWHTIILNPRMQGLAGNRIYEAIECKTAPKQGRSGGGLFTTDGYLAGVCNFAEPRGDHGLYAAPRSLYSLLDRNKLMALYAPVPRGSGTLVADGRSPAGARRTAVPIARSQSPDHEEPDSGRPVADTGDVMIPHPRLLGIAAPIASEGDRAPQAASTTTQRIAWRPTPRSAQTAAPTDLSLDPAADHDRFGPPPAEWQTQPSAIDPEDVAPGLDSGSTAGPSAKPRWRAVKTVPANRAAEPASH
jgi:hypothetical protein